MPDINSIVGSAADIARIAAAAAAQRAKGRVDEAGVNQSQGRAEADIFRTRMASAIGGPAAEAKNAALGDTLANVQPFAWGGTKMVGNIPVPQGSGGLTPANYGPATRSAGAALATQSAGRVNDPAFALPKPPVLAAVPQSGKLDSILGTAGGLGSIAGALPGADSGGNILGLAKDAFNAFKNRNTSANGLYYDPTFHDANNPDATGGVDPSLASNFDPRGDQPQSAAVDPSLAQNIDPMAEYQRWLASQQPTGGGSNTDMWTPDGSGWGGE